MNSYMYWQHILTIRVKSVIRRCVSLCRALPSIILNIGIMKRHIKTLPVDYNTMSTLHLYYVGGIKEDYYITILPLFVTHVTTQSMGQEDWVEGKELMSYDCLTSGIEQIPK